jgi:hypothetical protein
VFVRQRQPKRSRFHRPGYGRYGAQQNLRNIGRHPTRGREYGGLVVHIIW